MNTTNMRIMNETTKNTSYPFWHPYASIHKNFYDSINIVKGEGIYLYDVNGKEYLDASSGLWNVSLGYSDPRIQEEIIKQLKELPYCSLFEHTSPVVIKAANKIKELLPDYFQKIFFTCSGSESNELAVKLMRMYWSIKGFDEKKEILSLKNSYHGTYYASLSASDLEQTYLSDITPLVPGFHGVEVGKCSVCQEQECDTQCLQAFFDYVNKNYNKIAGIIIEPILSSDGVGIVDGRILEKIEKICKWNNVLITIDEIATGFYRTGKAFYYTNFEIIPDLVCMSKGINSGYLPFGAVAIRDELVTLFEQNNTQIIHGSTQDGNLLGCAACIVTIDRYQELMIEENVREQSSFLYEALQTGLMNHPNVKEIRGVGFLMEMELCHGEDSNRNLTIGTIVKIQRLLAEHGLIVYRSERGLTLLPMLILQREDAKRIVSILCNTFQNLYIE